MTGYKERKSIKERNRMSNAYKRQRKAAKLHGYLNDCEDLAFSPIRRRREVQIAIAALT